ncbi:hypothetical protein PORY_002781 [Pneumocystis oryctolagi]|uniref:Uncharacterized protein n=1 Tax=Pneumocystis oryctolagi TaxID=42067 RepID=A0ACB7CAA1_9ASCO|nr:hypothetical protein PORY_002781 [Pneumocystis oryctolagi]
MKATQSSSCQPQSKDALVAAREILGLSEEEELTQIRLRKAYHKCLLQYHPDKLKFSSNSRTVDEIRQAFDLLSHELQGRSLSPVKRLLSQVSAPPSVYETICLDEFVYVAEEDMFYRRCRCGDVYIFEVFGFKSLRLQMYNLKQPFVSGTRIDVLKSCLLLILIVLTGLSKWVLQRNCYWPTINIYSYILKL